MRLTTKRERREILAFKKETAMQYDKNKEHFEKNMAVYQNSIRRLTESLRMHLETADETFMDASTHGRIKPARVWKALYLDNLRVFERKDEVETPGFSVDILMDASSSRKTDAAENSSTGICTVKEPDKLWHTGADLLILQHKRLHGDAHL